MAAKSSRLFGAANQRWLVMTNPNLHTVLQTSGLLIQTKQNILSSGTSPIGRGAKFCVICPYRWVCSSYMEPIQVPEWDFMHIRMNSQGSGPCMGGGAAGPGQGHARPRSLGVHAYTHEISNMFRLDFILGPEWAPCKSYGRTDRGKLRRIPLLFQWD